MMLVLVWTAAYGFESNGGGGGGDDDNPIIGVLQRP